MKHGYVRASCGCGKLADVIPYGPNRDGRYGIITVTSPFDGGQEPTPCCSQQEGEYETEAEALEACEHLKKVCEQNVRKALEILGRAAEEIASVARMPLSEAFALRDQLAQQPHGTTCEVTLCFEQGYRVWLVADEREAQLCGEHVAGKKILDHRGLVVVAE